MFRTGNHVIYKSVKLQVKSISTSCVTFRSHYDSLGITPNATQADVKNAYYKLSKVYHPDKNKGCQESSKKFQDISNAYEVLGNFKLRKMYDKGLLPQNGEQPAPQEYPDHPEVKFYQSREKHRHKQAYTSSGAPIYDFDEWSKAHYGETFQRRYQAKRRWEERQAKVVQETTDKKTEKLLMLIFGLAATALFFGFTQEDYDNVKKYQK